MQRQTETQCLKSRLILLRYSQFRVTEAFSSVFTYEYRNYIDKSNNEEEKYHTQHQFKKKKKVKLLTFPSMNVLLCRNKQDLCFLLLYSFCAKTWKQEGHPVYAHDFRSQPKFTSHQCALRHSSCCSVNST